MIRLAGGSVAAIRDGAVCFEKRDIWFDPELNLILSEPSDTSGITVETTDCTGRYITPGLFDSHILYRQYRMLLTSLRTWQDRTRRYLAFTSKDRSCHLREQAYRTKGH